MKKDELLFLLEDQHKRYLNSLLDLSEVQLIRPKTIGEWSFKDVLSHLLMWEAETIKLLYQARQGMNPTTVHLKNVSDDEQNKIWMKITGDRPLERVLDDFTTIREQTIRRLDEFSDVELNDPGRFAWLHGKTLAQLVKEYILDHEQMHAIELQDWVKAQGSG